MTPHQLALFELRQQWQKGTISDEEFVAKSLDVTSKAIATLVSNKRAFGQAYVNRMSCNLAQDLALHFDSTI